MVCPEEQLVDNSEFLRQFGAKVRRQRIPMYGSIDLTYRCNLHCVHCYAAPDPAADGRRPREMTTAQVLSVIDQATEAGCLFLLLTGGEPLMRDDFPEIYRHAKRRGLIVTVFTNGIKIDDGIAGLFEDLPPLGVEISIYGATPGTHDRVTGMRGSYELSVQAVKRLMDRGIRVVLKTILMTINKDELDGMERFASELGLKFRFDAMVFAKLNGDKSPLKFRLTPDDAVRGEFSSAERLASWQKHAERDAGRLAAVSDKLYTCGTGLTCFHVDPCGDLHPCLMARTNGHSLVKGSFHDGWLNVVPKIREERATAGYACNNCERKSYCSACPASFQIEDAGEGEYYSFMCQVAERRAEGILKAK